MSVKFLILRRVHLLSLHDFITLTIFSEKYKL